MAEQQISTEQSQTSKHADNSHASVSVVKVTDQSDKFSTPESVYDLQSNIKEKINASTKIDTKFYDIAQPYDVLKELNVQVTPQLEEIDFYAGDRIPDQHDYAPMSVALRKLLHEQRSSQQKFRQKVELSQILNNLDEGQICFVGPAGSGKTTLLKAISRDVMEGNYENLKHIEIVHFVKCRGFRANDEVTPGELLFRNVNPELNKDEMNGSLEFAKYNPNKILFVIDSLDTLPYTLDGEHDVIGLCEEASPATILWNLLTNKLLPGCRSITSSREHTIRKYEGDLRANKVIALAGLTEESMKQIITGYLDEKEAEEIMSNLRINHSLLSLCKTPVFLVFTLIGLKAIISNFTPATMSGIMVLLLQSFLRSPHAHAKNIEDVIDKMKELAFTGTKERRVLFQTTELAQYGLKEEEATDVAVLAPGKSERRQRLLEGNSLLFFCHQSIQETLTAFRIAEMKLDEFKTFIAEQLHTLHYCVVRRILCGIMLNEDVTKAAGQLLKENDFQVKKSQLLKSLRGELVRSQSIDQDNADRLELFISLYEAGDGVKDLIASSVNAIYLYVLPFLLSDVHAIGFIIHHCTRLRTVRLSGCSLTSSSIQVLASSIKNSNVKILKLDLSNNPLDATATSSIGLIVKQCQVDSLILRGCNLSSEGLENFKASVGELKISKLNLSENPLDATAMSSIGRIVKQCRVDSMILYGCNLSSEGLENFKSSVGESKISDLTFGVTSFDTAAITLTLDIVQQCQVDVLKAEAMDHSQMNFSRKKFELELEGIRSDSTAMSHIGLFIKQCQVDSLILCDCKLSSGDLENFKSSVGKSKISKLNLSENPLDATAMSCIGRIVKQCQVDSMILRGCNLSSEGLENFKFFVENSKISKLNLSWNLLDATAMSSIGRIVKQCQVDSLDLSRCNLCSQGLENFKSSVVESKISKLHLSWNSLDATAMSCIGRIVKQCQVDSLILCCCKLSSEGLENFKSSVGESKISSLVLSENPLDATAMSCIGLIVKHCQVDLLNLSRCKLSSEGLENFKSFVGESKISVLDLSNDLFNNDYTDLRNDFSNPRAVNSLIPLLPNVMKELKLPEETVPEGHRQLLQHELDKLRPTKLKIVGLGQSYKEDWILEQHVDFKQPKKKPEKPE